MHYKIVWKRLRKHKVCHKIVLICSAQSTTRMIYINVEDKNNTSIYKTIKWESKMLMSQANINEKTEKESWNQTSDALFNKLIFENTLNLI